MREIVQKKVAAGSPGARYNILREMLQHLVLKILDEEGFFGSLSFVGGTALRVLFDLGRFSEDLDFSLQRPRDPAFRFAELLKRLLHRLDLYEFAVDTKTKEKGAVQSVFLRFRDILQETGATRRQGQKISIKLEVDTNPPDHAGRETRIVNKDFLFSVVHHDLPTLFAGKLLALLYRNYTKGRDLYDFVWYASRKTPVNRRFFESGLRQATGSELSWDRAELQKRVLEKIEAVDLKSAQEDLSPFLDDPSETRFFEKSLLQQLVPQIDYVPGVSGG